MVLGVASLPLRPAAKHQDFSLRGTGVTSAFQIFITVSGSSGNVISCFLRCAIRGLEYIRKNKFTLVAQVVSLLMWKLEMGQGESQLDLDLFVPLR